MPTLSSLNPPNISHLSDKELYEKCQHYGKSVRYFTKQFAALLPEVEKRKLYRKYGFHSVYEFAGTLAHMSHEAVTELFRVTEKIEDKPALKNLLATEGWSKVKVVATVATKTTDQFWAKKVRELPKHALAIYVREFVKSRPGAESGVPQQSENQATIFDNCNEGPKTDQAVPPQPSQIPLRMFLEPDIELRLRELQRKLSKEQKIPITFNTVVKFLLDCYESTKIKRSKKIATEEELEKLKNESCATRYIPASVKNFLHEKFHGRCAFPNCHKLPDIFHHTRRFSLVPNHNPDFLVPLCTSHERIAHLGLIVNEEKSPSEWYLQEEPDKTAKKFLVDEIVNRYRTVPQITENPSS